MSIGGRVIGKVAPDIHRASPHLNATFVHQTVHRAIHGIGPLPSAASAAWKQLEEQHGVVDEAVHEVIENHVALSAAQGFAANLGGIATAAVTIPANIAGLGLLQVRMVAAIAHLRGYDLSDGRVRNAILLCTLGEQTVRELIKQKEVPGSPVVLATAPAYDPELDTVVASEFTSALVSRILGKRAASTVIRRVPLAGGIWGGGADAYATWQIGRYAARELLARG